jgi:Protein of unknown function (DUF1769)
LLLGNDFDEPIRELLPPFFDTALQIVKKLVDPGIDGDPLCDKPYLFGPLLSSANVMRVGDAKGAFEGNDEEVLEEGAEGAEAKTLREKAGMPGEPGPRQKWFLKKQTREEFIFEKDVRYEFDFFNGYLDFNGKGWPTGANEPFILTSETRICVETANGHIFRCLAIYRRLQDPAIEVSRSMNVKIARNIDAKIHCTPDMC